MKIKTIYTKEITTPHGGETFSRAAEQENKKLLLLFFAGWGMDEKPFIHQRPIGADFMVCYDYRTLDFDETLLQPYQEIHLIGWSMGVWAASQVLQNKRLPITRSTAINGTPYPIDETRGIAPAVFEGTLNGLNETTLQKFRIRMCGNASVYKAFAEIAPQRSVAELKEELAAIGQQCKELPTSSFVWQEAVIGNADRIFLPANQQRAWQDTETKIEHVEEPHYVNNFLHHSPPTGEKATGERLRLIAQRFTKAIGTYPQESIVQHRIAEKMICLLQQSLPKHPYRQVVEFGCGTGTYSRMLLDAFRPQHLLLNDICNGMQESCRDLLTHNDHKVTFLPGDAESIPFPKETELITSCSALQWFEHPEEFFRRCNDCLQANGYFAFSTFGEKNMKEIRQLTGQGLPYRSKKELEASLAPFYDIVHSEEEIISLTFNTPMQVLYHLKQTGVTGTANQTWTRGSLNQFCHEYERQFSNGENAVLLTYHPIYMIAKKKQAV